MIITIDGPAASGKGTLAKLIAKELGLAHLDTGGLYRATALAMLRAGHDLADEAEAAACASTLDVSTLNDPQLRAQETGEAASQIARYAGVRAALLDFQRSFAANPPGNARGAVLDGRDTGSVICPGADIKFYVEASAKERARRRAAELAAKGQETDLADIEAEIIARDTQDKTRKEAPLVMPEQAHLLDTTQMSIETALAAAMDIISKATHA